MWSCLPAGAEEVVGDEADTALNTEAGGDADGAPDGHAPPAADGDADVETPQARLVLTASWLTMKEAALLAGALARSLPCGGQCIIHTALDPQT